MFTKTKTPKDANSSRTFDYVSTQIKTTKMHMKVFLKRLNKKIFLEETLYLLLKRRRFTSLAVNKNKGDPVSHV